MRRPPAAVRAVLERVPGMTPDLVDACRARRVGGLTNHTYRVSCVGRRVAVRLPGPGLGAEIDRHAEAHNAALAAGLGVAPGLVLADPACGVLVTEWVTGRRPFGAGREPAVSALTAAAKALRTLHQSGTVFRGQVRLAAELERYARLASSPGTPWPAHADAALRGASATLCALDAHPLPPAPCHNDPSPGNWVLRHGSALLLDWEYSAMNDPAWDLACLAAEANLDPVSETRLLAAYYGGAPDRPRTARHALLRPLADLLAALWLLAQDARDGHRAFEALAPAHTRLARAASALHGSGHRASLRALAGHRAQPPRQDGVTARAPAPTARRRAAPPS